MITFKVEKITPELASAYLATSRGNRNISKSVIERFSRDMKSGRWHLNGQGLIFDEEGHLLDGHHRLNAVIKSGATIESTVTRGIDAETFSSLDNGHPRTLGQNFKIKKAFNSNALSSVINCYLTLVSTGRVYYASSSDSVKMSNIEKNEIYSFDKDGFDESTSFAMRHYGNSPIIKESWIGGLHYWLTRNKGFGKNVVDSYFSELCSLKNSRFSSVELLRTRLITMKMKGIKLQDYILYALFVKSFNGFVQKRNIAALRLNPEEVYPKIVDASNSIFFETV